MVKPNAPVQGTFDNAHAVEFLRLEAEIKRLEESKSGKGQGEIAEIQDQIRQRRQRQALLFASAKAYAPTHSSPVAISDGERTTVRHLVAGMVTKMDSELHAMEDDKSIEYRLLLNQKTQLEEAQTLLAPSATEPSGASGKKEPPGG